MLGESKKHTDEVHKFHMTNIAKISNCSRHDLDELHSRVDRKIADLQNSTEHKYQELKKGMVALSSSSEQGFSDLRNTSRKELDDVRDGCSRQQQGHMKLIIAVEQLVEQFERMLGHRLQHNCSDIREIRQSLNT